MSTTEPIRLLGERGRLARRFRPLPENIPSESSWRDANCGDRDGRAPHDQAYGRGEKFAVLSAKVCLGISS
jgi:hypothetical protein